MSYVVLMRSRRYALTSKHANKFYCETMFFSGSLYYNTFFMNVTLMKDGVFVQNFMENHV